MLQVQYIKFCTQRSAELSFQWLPSPKDSSTYAYDY